jgi:low temperature requirement protein LtrA
MLRGWLFYDLVFVVVSQLSENLSHNISLADTFIALFVPVWFHDWCYFATDLALTISAPSYFTVDDGAETWL